MQSQEDVESNPFQEDRLDDATSADGEASRAREEANDGEDEVDVERAQTDANVPLGQPDVQYRQHEASEDPIQIVDALKTSQGSSTTYIVYCVRFDVSALSSSSTVLSCMLTAESASG